MLGRTNANNLICSHAVKSKAGSWFARVRTKDKEKEKFVLISTIVPEPLSNENYPIWKSQILKLLRANGFANFLDNAVQKPSRLLQYTDGSSELNPAYTHWILVDQNLAAALCSTISSSILPYVLHLDRCADIWTTLEQRLQASNRSRVIQLKHELHNILMRNLSMTQYLTAVKTLILREGGLELASSSLSRETSFSLLLFKKRIKY
ncbi:hypothetical protein KFK09_019316 [Dendrobium nobile]|uniref:Retrovirus-related Pol polyprotein from transposon TNT 1-94 n=1 Tax=Dendrobium nobile TaxID=94219 RepID=A0A8T3AYR4_DENNO|nr:hypothetical protein KFK09_019316 [Dendrobium nobile]